MISSICNNNYIDLVLPSSDEGDFFFKKKNLSKKSECKTFSF